MAACSYEAIANGVGPFSFTHQLNTELRQLASTRGSFTVGELYDHVHDRMQSYKALGVPNERYPSPIYLFLTRDDAFASRSIELSVLPNTSSNGCPQNTLSRVLNTSDNAGKKRALSPEGSDTASKKICNPPGNVRDGYCRPQASGVFQNVQSSRTEKTTGGNSGERDRRTMLFAVRLDETMVSRDLVLEAFEEWFRKIPAHVEEVSCKVEAQFLCDSTLLILSVPISMWASMEDHPALIPLGPVKSSNILSAPLDLMLGAGSQSARLQENRKRMVTFADRVPMPSPSSHSVDCVRLGENFEHSVVDYDADGLSLEKSPESRAEVPFAVSGPALVYVRNIQDKYPDADEELVRRLGQANWERHVRLRKIFNQESAPATERSFFKPASFRDSALGSSIQIPTDYEPSVATSFASNPDDSDSNHFRVPPLPQESRPGAGFICPFCRTLLLDVRSRASWK